MMFIGTSSTLGFMKMLNNELAYEPVKDFTPVAMVGSVPIGIFTSGTSGIKSVPDLMIHVPYTGAQQRYWDDVLGGRLTATMQGVTGGLAMAKEGKLNLIAVSSRERSKLLPDVPAVGEAYPGFDVPAWFGLAVAAGARRTAALFTTQRSMAARSPKLSFRCNTRTTSACRRTKGRYMFPRPRPAESGPLTSRPRDGWARSVTIPTAELYWRDCQALNCSTAWHWTAPGMSVWPAPIAVPSLSSLRPGRCCVMSRCPISCRPTSASEGQI